MIISEAPVRGSPLAIDRSFPGGQGSPHFG